MSIQKWYLFIVIVLRIQKMWGTNDKIEFNEFDEHNCFCSFGSALDLWLDLYNTLKIEDIFIIHAKVSFGKHFIA